LQRRFSIASAIAQGKAPQTGKTAAQGNIRDVRSRLARERASLHIHDHTVIASIRATYGATIRAHRSA